MVNDPDAVTTPRRICVKGTSGAGKSTFAAELARRLDLPCIELDALFWGPNWTEPDRDVFRACVCETRAAASQGVIDGNYDSRLGDTVLGAAGGNSAAISAVSARASAIAWSGGVCWPCDHAAPKAASPSATRMS